MTGFFSPAIPPIVCDYCGSSAHLIRRIPYGDGELRTFECAQCGRQYMRSSAGEESDEEIQRTIERMIAR